MDTWYWILEYGKVLFGYLFLMFLWPSAVFGGHLREKGIVYRLSFCVTVQIVIANTAVLVPGLFHILRPSVIAVFFYGTFLFALLKQIIKRSIGLRVKETWRQFCRHIEEYGVLAVLLIFGMIYFSYGAFQVHSYGFGDLYTHHQWIYGLKEGRIFADGVYPEAMHCFIYCLDALFGIRVYSSLLFLQGIHVAVFLLAGYLLLREIFCWRYTPLLALALFLTLEVSSADLVYSMFRLQITLPLEFGLYTQFLCALYLLRYLRNTHRTLRKGRLSKYCLDDNLFLFLMSLTASISIHFYTTIMAFVLCASFAVFMLKKVFSKEKFIPLAVSVLCACVVAAFPMAGALASGIPFNYSINWAVKAMDGEETRQLEEKDSSDEPPKKEQAVRVLPFEKLKGICTKGYVSLYGQTGAGIILFVTGVSAVLCLFSKKKLPKWLGKIPRGYPPLILFTFLFISLYAAPRIGLPEIISDSRFCSVGHMMVMALVLIPADVLISILVHFCRGRSLKLLPVFSVAGIYALAILTGHFHGYLFFELSRYNSAVDVTNSIIETYPEKSYVIVSPTDELYPVIEYGWHEELLGFMKNIGNEDYVLAPEHVFVYVEKRPLQYAQAYFFDGPPWLAQAKYKDVYWEKYSKKYPDTGAVQGPKINAAAISEEGSQKDLTEYSNPWHSYTRLPERTILESKANDWCRNLLETYPGEAKIYYEDDDFVCYYFRQDSDSGIRVDRERKVETETYSFAESSRALQNPNRGFYNLYSFLITDEGEDYSGKVSALYQNDTDTKLSLVQICLKNYRQGLITKEGLANIDALFSVLESLDKQLIVRFTYDSEGKNELYEPEDLDIILEHMGQLSDILHKYSEKIFSLQGLFIGNWGEMNGTRYSSQEELGKLAEKLARVTEPSTYLAVRMPAQWRGIMEFHSGNQGDETDNLLTGRLGLFNDGMFGNESDYGTYRMGENKDAGSFPRLRREEELEFQNELCRRVPNGGETINANSYNDFDNAVRELAVMHVTYLNRGYDREVLEKWAEATVTEKGCFEGMDGLTYIERHLGYRFVLTDARLRYKSKEDVLTAEVDLKNVGFAPLYKEAKVRMIVYDKKNDRLYTYPVGQKLQSLAGGDAADDILTLSADIPFEKYAEKEYVIYFSVSDADTGEPVLLANKEDEEQYGYRIGRVTLQ